jgi:hypothetical protein
MLRKPCLRELPLFIRSSKKKSHVFSRIQQPKKPIRKLKPLLFKPAKQLQSALAGQDIKMK